MKKIFTLLRMLCICFLLGAMLTACQREHEHVMKNEWEKNETHHWRSCEDKDCTEVTGYSTHYWDNGKITTPPSAQADGEKTFTCEICGQTKGLPILAE